MNTHCLPTVVLICLSIASCGAQEVFHKALNNTNSVSVLEHPVPEWQKSDMISSAHDYVLTLNTSGGARQVLWTNRYFHYEHADPIFNTHKVFDAMLIDNCIHLCYERGGLFCIETIASPLLDSSGTDIARFDLLTGHLMPNFDTLIDGVFSISTNGITTLTAKGEADEILVWEYRTNEWIINSALSSPEEAWRAAQKDYTHWILKSKQWTHGSLAIPLD